MEESINTVLLEVKSLREELTLLIKEVNENEKLLLELLQKNNNDTEKIHKAIIEDKSTEQQMKDFLLNIAANIAGNAIRTPVIIDASNIFSKY